MPSSAVTGIPKSKSKHPPNPQVLILGIGNILLSDEGFGVHAVKTLQERFQFPPNVAVIDGGTGGLSLLSELKDKDYLFIIDAVLLGEKPGTIAQFSYDSIPPNYRKKETAHGIDILDVLAAAHATSTLPGTTILGVQPADISSPGLELSPEISAAMEPLIDTLLAQLSHLGIKLSR